MSKIGRKPIKIGNIKVEIQKKEVHYKGARASGVYILPKELDAILEDGNLKIIVASDVLLDLTDLNRVWGLNRALLANKIHGADYGFEKKMQIIGLGFKASLSGKKVVFSLGFSHKIEIDLPNDISLEIDKTGQLLTFKASEKETLGHICSKIRALRPPEPYKGTGIKWISEVIRRKAGKAKVA